MISEPLTVNSISENTIKRIVSHFSYRVEIVVRKSYTILNLINLKDRCCDDETTHIISMQFSLHYIVILFTCT